MITGYVVIPLVVDVFLVWFLLAKQLPDAKTTPLLLVREAPDLGLLLILILLFTLGWGTLRTLLMLQILFRKSPSKQESSRQQQNLGQVA